MCGPRIQKIQCRAFTLIEILIVVTILGILAAVLIPQLPELKRSAGETALKQNLVQVRMAIIRYTNQHKGKRPAQVSDGANAAATELCLVQQVRSATDSQGIALSSSQIEGGYGPYLHTGIPICTVGQLQDQRNVRIVDVFGKIQADAAPAHAWKYNIRTGQFICNSNELCLGESIPYWQW